MTDPSPPSTRPAPAWTRAVLRFWGVFTPRPDAGPAELRLNGLGAAAVGLVVTVLGSIVFVKARGLMHAGDDHAASVPRIFGVPLAAGYVLLMTGLFRLISGKPPGAESRSGLASLGRVFLGVVLTIGGIFAGLMLFHRLLDPSPIPDEERSLPAEDSSISPR